MSPVTYQQEPRTVCLGRCSSPAGATYALSLQVKRYVRGRRWYVGDSPAPSTAGRVVWDRWGATGIGGWMDSASKPDARPQLRAARMA